MRTRTVLSCLFLGGIAGVLGSDINEVDPKALPRKTASCKALNRATNELKDITIDYIDVNPEAKKTLIMVHGWPGIWHSWKYQIEALKNDYHIIALNQRGFGGSTAPGDVKSSGTMGDLVGDLTCVLEDAGVEKAACFGHDWGTEVCYEAARMRPDVFDAVVGTCIPYIPFSGSFTPTEYLIPAFPKLAYTAYFDKLTEKAAEELNKDIRRSIRATIRSMASPPPAKFLKSKKDFLAAWEQHDEIPPIPYLTPAEEDYWVEEFGKLGFDDTFIFYTHGNRYANWELAQAQGNHTITVPALSILSLKDPVANWVQAAKFLQSDKHFSQLTTKTVESGHWLILEKHEEVNSILKEWLDEHYPSLKKAAHHTDEL